LLNQFKSNQKTDESKKKYYQQESQSDNLAFQLGVSFDFSYIETIIIKI
jgi:hypothetical protein